MTLAIGHIFESPHAFHASWKHCFREHIVRLLIVYGIKFQNLGEPKQNEQNLILYHGFSEILYLQSAVPADQKFCSSRKAFFLANKAENKKSTTQTF